MNFSAPQPRSD